MLDEKKKQRLCLQCMECCKLLAIPLTDISKEAIEFYTARGCWIDALHGGRIGVIIPFPCPHLTPQGCNIYDTRPKACRDSDGTKDPLVRDKCLWIKENRKKK